jgi:hypothetical protein
MMVQPVIAEVGCAKVYFGGGLCTRRSPPLLDKQAVDAVLAAKLYFLVRVIKERLANNNANSK